VSVSLYDLLDVDRDASPEEIRTAWKDAISDLEPGDRRFRAFNEAAEVLLDPERRAAYDAELDATAPEPETEPEPVEAPGAETVATPQVAPEAEAAVAPATGWRGRLGHLAPTTWLLVGLLALTLVLAGSAVWLTKDQPSDDSIERALRTAEGVAQTAVPTVFSYDYRHLDEDHDKAAAYLTEDYRTERGGYDDTFESVIQVNAPRLKAVVESEFISSGIIRTGGGDQADDRVEVLVVFDQLTTNKQVTDPQRQPAYAVVTMQKVDGDWLIDDVNGPEVPQ
jgi:Mce-associated membrane protein